MSLVAYNASDDSDDDSDGGTFTNSVDKAQDPIKAADSVSGHISDEDEFDTVSSTTLSTTSTLLQPLQLPGNSDFVDSTSIASLEDLPAPRSAVAATIHEEDELEEEVKPKAFEVENAQKPPDKKKQPVKITIPSLDKFQTDVDEDEDLPRKPTPSLTKIGLFSLLPPPIHSSKKEINRQLIPHTLTKKPQTTAHTSSQAKPHTPIQKPSVSTHSSETLKPGTTKRVALTVAMYGSDSDDDDGDNVSTSNFFSLDSFSNPAISKHESAKNIQIKEISSSEVSSQSMPSRDAQIKPANSFQKVSPQESGDNKIEKESEPVMTRGPEPGAVNDSPLDFGHANSKLWSSSSSSSSTFSQGYLGAVGLAGPVASSHNSLPTQENNLASASAQYNLPDSEMVDNGYLDTVGDDDLKQFMSDKEFHRLSGKRKRGLEEAINFVDANVDDYVDPSEVSKHLTEETEYVSHKNKDNMPTAQQRKKKQITYLAYQAKEREFELKNAWAQNRMTKKQTQSKYGF